MDKEINKNTVDKINYKEIGLKSGLEIHQQLDTNKLFCNCPSLLRNDKPDFTVERKLHAVAGESGEIDEAAKHEALIERKFVYQGYDTTCLVELDEEPPHFINEEALKIALQISILLNCKIFPIVQIMRKTVIDGSNTSGFQRTLLLASDGFIETLEGKVGIESVCLEEDAARIIEKNSEKEGKIVSTFRLDRLGIPLVEIATKPDIKSAEQAKEAALHIGDVLRACKVKRGIGTIRQDVNLSVRNGKRVELKGFQDIRNIEKAIEKETLRQIELVKKGKSVGEVRNVLPSGESEFLRPIPGSARMYPETDLPLLKIKKQLIDEIKKTLPKLRTEISGELKELGLDDEMIKLVLGERKVEEFKELMILTNKANLAVKMLCLYGKEISSHEKVGIEKTEEILNQDVLASILNVLAQGKITEDNVKEVMLRIVKGMSFNEAIKFEKINLNEIEEKVHNIIKNKPGLNANAYMGLVMVEFKGKLSGKEAMEIILKFLK